MHMQSPFLDRLAAAHAGQNSRHSDAHTQDEAQPPAIGTSYPGPDLATGSASEPNQATDAYSKPNQATGAAPKPNQATQSSAEKAQGGHQVSAGAVSDEEEGKPDYQYGAPDPMAGDQTLASNLAFQQELQQRSSQRDARAEALRKDGGGAQPVAEGGLPGGQEGAQRGPRYHSAYHHHCVVSPSAWCRGTGCCMY